MYVKTAFLNGLIRKRFEVQDRDSHVCTLKKSLYGLKQAPRAWYERIDSYLMKLGFTQSNADLNLYLRLIEKGLSF